MSNFDVDASVDATMAADHEPWTMPPCDNPDCPVGCPDSHCAPYHLLDEVRLLPKPCARCGGNGWIEIPPWKRRFPCPECSK